MLGLQRAAKCLEEQCAKTEGCGLRTLCCKKPIYYGGSSIVRDKTRLAWAENREARSTCLDNADNYDYGAYAWSVQLITNDSRLEKILFPIFWGLMTLRYLPPFFLFCFVVPLLHYFAYAFSLSSFDHPFVVLHTFIFLFPDSSSPKLTLQILITNHHTRVHTAKVIFSDFNYHRENVSQIHDPIGFLYFDIR